jgi:coenzyme F420-0:L-glutamate ligase / coenzyme F420-1:gamma-L-glutamate ligase
VARLTEAQREMLEQSRHAVLGTTAADGRPRLVPLVFAIAAPDDGPTVIYSALDEKPKTVSDPHQLARVRDIVERPAVSVLVDRWDEDWSRLGWLRLDGRAKLLEPDGDDAGEHGAAVRLLRGRYAQYATHKLEERPVLRIEVDRVVDWSAS